MKKIILLFTIFFLISSVSYASFPVTEPIEKSPTTEIIEPIVYGDSPWPNIVSLSCAVIAIILGSIAAAELAIPALILFTAAIVFGSIGFSRSVKGLGISGFILGILGAIGAAAFLAS